MPASPMRIVQSLWGGKLPTFDSVDEANELLSALVMGMWNRLTRHQERGAPFRLTRIESKSTRKGLAALALLRCQELDGFVDEDIDYARRLNNAGVPVEFHLYPGACHGFDAMVPNSAPAMQLDLDVARWLDRHYGTE